MAIKDVILGYAKGEKGDPGPRGEKGNTGATGPKGDPGNIADAQITDTEGLDVAKGQKTTAQKLFDAIANRIVTKLVTNDALTKKLADYMLKGMMSNTNVNNTGTVPTSALMYSMFEQINNNLGSLLKPTTETVNIDSLNLENGTYVIGTGMSGTKPFEYGILIQFKRYTYTIQIAIDIDSAAIAKRQTNNERWPNWDFYVTKSDLVKKATVTLNLSEAGTAGILSAKLGIVVGVNTNNTNAICDLISIDDQWYVRFREITSDVPITGQVTLDYWYIPAQ